MEQAAQAGELPVQPHRGAAQPPELGALVAQRVVDHAVLDAVEFLAERVDHAVDGVGDVLHDGLQQRRHGGEPAAFAQGLPRRLDGVQGVMAAADHHAVGHHEVQVPDLVGRLIELAHDVGDHAVDAGVLGVKLLVMVGGEQEVRGGRRGPGLRGNPALCALVREVEVQPDPAVVAVVDRLLDGKLLGRAVGVDAERPDQAGSALAAGQAGIGKRRRDCSTAGVWRAVIDTDFLRFRRCG